MPGMYHLSVKTHGRATGASAVAKAAYRSGAELTDARTGEVHDYTRKGGVDHSELVLPAGSPAWATDREILWNAAEQAETRKNATVMREFEVALPAGLNPAQRIALVQDFSHQLVDRHGFAVDLALHQPGPGGDQRNYHAHISCTTRRLGPDGFGDKTRELDGGKSGSEHVTHWREQWALTANRHLDAAGHTRAQHIDARTLEAQGIEREPTLHLGVHATALERQGIPTQVGNRQRAIQQRNRVRSRSRRADAPGLSLPPPTGEASHERHRPERHDAAAERIRTYGATSSRASASHRAEHRAIEVTNRSIEHALRARTLGRRTQPAISAVGHLLERLVPAVARAVEHLARIVAQRQTQHPPQHPPESALMLTPAELAAGKAAAAARYAQWKQEHAVPEQTPTPQPGRPPPAGPQHVLAHGLPGPERTVPGLDPHHDVDIARDIPRLPPWNRGR